MQDRTRPTDYNTLCVHAGEGVDPGSKALRRPINMANSYELPTDIEELLTVFSWDHLDKFQYTREHSATPRHLEERLAALEGTEDCVVAASGMGAVAKRPETFGQSVVLAVMAETFAIFGLLIAILIFVGTKIMGG